MATLTAGYIYLIESDAGDNQNWLHDPETIVVGNFTDGTDICSLKIPRTFTKQFSTGVQVTTGAAGNEFDYRAARRAYAIMAQGIETSISNANTVEKFIMSDRHTSGSSTTFVRYYLVIKFGSNDYVEFTDSTGTRREYCTGIVLNGVITWRESSSQTALVRFNFKSVW